MKYIVAAIVSNADSHRSSILFTQLFTQRPNSWIHKIQTENALVNKNNNQTAPMEPQAIDPARQFWTARHRELS